MNKLSFQKMWEAGPLGVISGDLIVAFNLSHNPRLKKEVGIVEKNVVFYFDAKEGSQFYFESSEMKKASEYGFKRFSDKKKVEEYIKYSKNKIREVDVSYNNFLKQKWRSNSPEKLLEMYKEHLIIYEGPYAPFHACQPQYFEKLENYVLSNIKKAVPEERVEDVYSALTTSSKDDALAREEIEWLKIVDMFVSERPEVKEFDKRNLNENEMSMIKNHSDKYIYLGTVEAHDAWDIDHYIKLLNKDVHSDVRERRKKLFKRKDILTNQKKEILSKYNISEEVLVICNNLSKIGLNRLDLRFSWTKASYMNIEILNELVSRDVHLAIDENTISALRLDEVLSILSDDSIISESEIDRRKKSFLFFSDDFVNKYTDEIEFFSGEEAIKKKSELIEEEQSYGEEVTGNVASKGKVAGKVSLFLWTDKDMTKKMEEMEEGSILVAGQTRPFLMPAIKKAAAIVTDEGGITSHAAIVSRELGVPCVIGTKIGTKVFKDGDMVEVDAENGVVRKIS